ncbi:MAG: hypothetical protein IJ899_02945 [Blautia sp.]|nr:hypothetical protein [Blautia sp.]
MALDIISTINLDLKRPNTETVYAVQYDTAGRIKAQLTNDGEAWHVPSSAGGMVSFRKSDNIGGFYDTTELGEVAVSVDENDDSIIYIALDAQTTITATPLDHPVQMQINFYNSQGKRLSTFAFYLRVQASVLFDGDQDERPAASEWTFRILTGALGQTIKNQEDAIKWMADNIRTQAGYVVDDTLKVPGAAGDAKKIGELFEEIVKISDSMPGYFPTMDTERVGSTKYYTRSGTSPDYVYTEFTGATFATGVTYYEYSPWNRIWIDPDDNDVVIPTMDDIDELNRHLSDVTEAIEDISKRINLFDKRTVVSGGYFSSAGGILPNANSEYSTQYIKVDPSKTYSMSKAKTGAEFLTYNQNKQFISGGRITPSTNINFSFGSGVYYVRLSFYNTTFGNDFMLVEGATVPSTYVGYINYIEGSSVLPGSLDVSALPASISDSINANTGAFSREIRDNANWTFYGNYFPSSAGTQNASANYNEYYFVAPSDFEIWTDTDLWSGTDCDDFWLKLYTGLPFGTETNVTGVYRQRKNSSGVITSDTMPKENSKLKVTAGQYVVISYYKTVSYFRFMVSGLESAYYYGNDKIVLSEDTCKQIAASDAFKTCKFIYNAYTGPYPGDFYHTERVCIYLPAKYGYVRHSLYHCVLESAYADSWRLAPSLACDDNYIKRFDLTVGGEWEFAVKLNGRDDFSGGITHGDEIYTNITFFLDGEEITITDYTALTLFNELRVVETTDVYDPADHTTVIGVHTREYVFNSDGLRLRQTMKWAGVFPVLNAYMPMYLPAKTSNGITVTNEIVLDSNYTPFSIPASRFNYTFPDTKNCVIYSAESAAIQAVDCTWQVVNVARSGEFNLTDNANNNYNKIYYRTVENTVYNTSENELWKSEQHVKISISDNS